MVAYYTFYNLSRWFNSINFSYHVATLGMACKIFPVDARMAKNFDIRNCPDYHTWHSSTDKFYGHLMVQI